MSDIVLPTFPGQDWSTTKTPVFKTRKMSAVSGREVRNATQAYPLWKFGLGFEFLRDTAAIQEFKQLMGMFAARMGMWDSFLFTDPDDNSVTDQSLGTGDGSTVAYQLVRTYGTGSFLFAEPVQNVNGAPTIKVASATLVAGTDYTISSTGLVTFTTAPAIAASITWTGSFYYRCRFNMDSNDFNNFMQGAWSSKIELIGSPMNKV